MEAEVLFDVSDTWRAPPGTGRDWLQLHFLGLVATNHALQRVSIYLHYPGAERGSRSGIPCPTSSPLPDSSLEARYIHPGLHLHRPTAGGARYSGCEIVRPQSAI